MQSNTILYTEFLEQLIFRNKYILNTSIYIYIHKYIQFIIDGKFKHLFLNCLYHSIFKSSTGTKINIIITKNLCIINKIKLCNLYFFKYVQSLKS